MPLFSTPPIHQHLLRALEKLGINQPTPVQTQAIPLILRQKDLLVSAETGSGKTIAFLLPTFQRLLDNPDTRMGTRTLILVPTRELARQIFDQCMAIGSYTQFRFGVIIGGESFQKQTILLRKNPEFIIATPGRMVDHLARGTLFLSDLEMLILDEADRMLDMGFSEDVLKIADQCNRQRQTLLFSATLNHKDIKGIASKVLNDPEVISLNTVKDKHRNIEQQVVLADNNGHKAQILNWLLDHESYSKSLIFTNKKTETERLASALLEGGQRVGVLHGDMGQKQRNLVMERFHRGQVKALVATDVAARGIDVQGIDLVVNFDMPRTGKDYVHRIGRTGRAGKKGVAISLISHPEWNLMAGIERYLQQQFKRRTIKSLEGQYTGPKKLKSSGKRVGPKKKKNKEKVKPTIKVKLRHRVIKQIGKRRKPSGDTAPEIQDSESNDESVGRVWGKVKKKSS